MTVTNFDPSAAAVKLTDAALRHFKAALVGRESKLVRLSTKNSGCSGYTYVLDLVDTAETDDVVMQPSENVRLAIAQDALELVRGTEIDMVVEGVNRTVKFNNPNVAGECGCGESFSVD